jgi:hypothetical protein
MARIACFWLKMGCFWAKKAFYWPFSVISAFLEMPSFRLNMVETIDAKNPI